MSMNDKILKLRKTGMSYSQIAKELGCTKGNISYCINKYDAFTADELTAINNNTAKLREISRQKSTDTMSKIWQQRHGNTKLLAIKQYNDYKPESLFMLGLGLYLGEGSKNNVVSFSNLNIDYIKIFMKWAIKYLGACEFSGSLSIFDTGIYDVSCNEVNKLLNCNIKWGKPKIDKRHKHKLYQRNFGVVTVVVLKVPLAIRTVKTWMELVNEF